MGVSGRRIGLAGTVAVSSALAIVATLSLSAGARAGGEAELLPDLVTLAIADEDLVLAREHGRRLLRLSNEVANVGPGPLEIFPSEASSGCDGDADAGNDRDASQRLYADSNLSGAYERSGDSPSSERPFGCLRYHPAHDHWHTLEFSSYELRRERSGRRLRMRRKVGFCVGDRRIAFPPPRDAETPLYPLGGDGDGNCDDRSTQGLSIGWADLYAYNLPGQQIRVGGLPAGRYCLISRADPANLIAEQNDANNVRRVRIRLRPRAFAVEKLRGSCRR